MIENKLLAVKMVTSNKGAITPGVDGIIWNTSAKKMWGALLIKRKGYRAQPLKRKEIPKTNGKKKNLGMSTLRDRTMQALYLLTLEQVAESNVYSNSYGFRSYRACKDAIAQCFCSLVESYSPKGLLNKDIKPVLTGYTTLGLWIIYP